MHKEMVLTGGLLLTLLTGCSATPQQLVYDTVENAAQQQRDDMQGVGRATPARSNRSNGEYLTVGFIEAALNALFTRRED